MRKKTPLFNFTGTLWPHVGARVCHTADKEGLLETIKAAPVRLDGKLDGSHLWLTDSGIVGSRTEEKAEVVLGTRTQPTCHET